MIITWYGHSCFKIEARGVTLAIDPFSKAIGLTPPRFHADIVLVSHSHPDHANAATIHGSPQIISGPGEYEIKGISIQGLPAFHDARRGQDRGLNTIFRIKADNIVIVHLGDFGESGLNPETAEALADIDILLIPIGGKPSTIEAKTAAAISAQIEPSIVIPMHYKIPGLSAQLAGLEPFLKELGVKPPEKLAKLTVKKKDLEARRTKLVVLIPSAAA